VISLVLAMVWARRSQAVTLALLSMFAVAAAVAAPAYLRAADRAVAAGQVAAATPDERGIVISTVQDDRTGPVNDGTGTAPVSFTDIGAALADLPGFSYVYAAEYPAIGVEKNPQWRSRFVYRQGVCGHLTMLTGRCLIGEGEVVVGDQTARRLSLATGDSIVLRFARFNSDPRVPVFLPDGEPKKLAIVGTYRVPDTGDLYWGTHGYFTEDPGDRPGEPFFTDAATLGAMDHGSTQVSIDGTAGPHALDVDNLPRLRAGLDATRDTAIKIGSGVTLGSQLTDLLDRVDAGRAAARLIVPVLAVPLVLLACLSIFLAVSYGTEGRRPELAVVALRGARWGLRWWLATGENLVAIVIGAVAGCVAGQLLVNAVVAVRFPGVGAAAGVSSLRYAPVAAATAVVAALLAERRQLLSPVAELLRRAPAVPAGARAVAIEAAVALLAVVSGLQLVISHGSLTGVGLVAPALIVLALALFAARALLPGVTRSAGRALRGGRLGIALAGFQLSRRPGAARLFALLVAAVAVAGYAACAIDVAARGRMVEAGIGTGAPRVVTVDPVPPSRLIAATDAVDPHRQYAMAVARVPGRSEDPVVLGVDTTRLAATAFWPDGAPPIGEVAGRLRPAAAAPITMPGQDLTVDATATGLNVSSPIRLNAVVSSVRGLGDATVGLGEVIDGPFTYQQRVPICQGGCTLKALTITTVSPSSSGVTGRVIIRALRTVNPSRSAVPTAQLADPARWRRSGPGAVSAAPDGLRIDVDAPTGFPTNGLIVQPVDTPYPLPVAFAGPAYADALSGLDGRSVPVSRVARLPAVPAAGVRATLVDLRYADLLSASNGDATNPQIWLSGKAPPDILDRLSARGLVVVSDVQARQVRRQLDGQGPAIALWFYVLAGGLAIALAAGALILAATVDRGRRVEDLSALRAQGLGRGPLRQATLWTYPVLVAIAVVAGTAIALLGWGLTGWALPLAGLDPPPLPLPGWPRAWVVAGTGVAVLVVLALVAYFAGRRTLKEIA
jgi:putative ABC transport system permease protein